MVHSDLYGAGSPTITSAWNSAQRGIWGASPWSVFTATASDGESCLFVRRPADIQQPPVQGGAWTLCAHIGDVPPDMPAEFGVDQGPSNPEVNDSHAVTTPSVKAITIVFDDGSSRTVPTAKGTFIVFYPTNVRVREFTFTASHTIFSCPVKTQIGTDQGSAFENDDALCSG
jgi:hypothetical protein